MDLGLLGFDRIDEAVAPSLGLDIEYVPYVRTFPSELTLVDQRGAYAQVSHDIFARPRADLVQPF
jgi:hypothetical protein